MSQSLHRLRLPPLHPRPMPQTLLLQPQHLVLRPLQCWFGSLWPSDPLLPDLPHCLSSTFDLQSSATCPGFSHLWQPPGNWGYQKRKKSCSRIYKYIYVCMCICIHTYMYIYKGLLRSNVVHIFMNILDTVIFMHA